LPIYLKNKEQKMNLRILTSLVLVLIVALPIVARPKHRNAEEIAAVNPLFGIMIFPGLEVAEEEAPEIARAISELDPECEAYPIACELAADDTTYYEILPDGSWLPVEPREN
jgi:hypothetical protein